VLFRSLKKYYTEVIRRLSEIISNKLNITYKNYFHALREEKRRKELQKESNIFLIGACIIFGLGMTMDRIVTMYYIDVKSIWFNWMYVLIILLPIVAFIKTFSYSLKDFGVTTRNFLPSLQTGLMLTGLLWIGGIFGVTLKSVNVDLPFYQQIIAEVVKNTPASYVLSYLAHSYIQEFIARGVIQTTLQKFLEDERGLKANLFTSGLFAIFHIYKGLDAVIITFLASLAFGWVYLRDRNLVGVSLFHWSAGTVSRLMGGM
jgi:membrane protease YdiL (CAAX protease family)